MIQDQIYALLSGAISVTAIVGGKIFPVRLPRDTEVPAVVYHVPGADPVSSINGDSGLDNNIIEITSWAKDYATALELAQAVREVVAGSDLKMVIEDQGDGEDPDTRNYSVILTVRAWSGST